MTVDQIAARLAIGPATVGELLRAGATEDQIAGLVRTGCVAILQHHADPEALIIGGYGLPAPLHQTRSPPNLSGLFYSFRYNNDCSMVLFC